MGVFELFSKRQKKLNGEIVDVYIYNQIPKTLRVQIVHILNDTLGNYEKYFDSIFGTANAYKIIVEILCREYGVFFLAENHAQTRSYISELHNFILSESDTDKILDAIELSFKYINKYTREFSYLRNNYSSEYANIAIEELNSRFHEHGIGYQFIENQIIRLDSEFIHAEVVKPALALLQDKQYVGAQLEFLKAHEHYRNGRMKETMTECLKAFESVMKIICTKRRWSFNPNDTSKKLIAVLFDKGLIPDFWDNHFAGLRSTLEGGIPTARNRTSGHGQGAVVKEVPHHFVEYVLHLTASTIVFLVEAEKSLP